MYLHSCGPSGRHQAPPLEAEAPVCSQATSAYSHVAMTSILAAHLSREQCCRRFRARRLRVMRSRVGLPSGTRVAPVGGSGRWFGVSVLLGRLIVLVPSGESGRIACGRFAGLDTSATAQRIGSYRGTGRIRARRQVRDRGRTACPLRARSDGESRDSRSLTDSENTLPTCVRAAQSAEPDAFKLVMRFDYRRPLSFQPCSLARRSTPRESRSAVGNTGEYVSRTVPIPRGRLYVTPTGREAGTPPSDPEDLDIRGLRDGLRPAICRDPQIHRRPAWAHRRRRMTSPPRPS